MNENALPKVLIVDDQKSNIVAIERVLQDLDVTTLTAQSGQEAIGQLLRHKDVALILLDVQMPEMDGFETATFIRRDPDTSAIPIIFVTAISKEDKYVAKGYEAGAVDYLFKPVDVDVLIGKVKVFTELYLEKRKTLQALENIKTLKTRQEQLLNHAAEGVLGLDASGTIQFANFRAIEMLCTENEGLVGISMQKIMAPHASPQEWAESSFTKLIENGGALAVDDVHFHSLSGEAFSVAYTQSVYNESKNRPGVVLLFQDITERKQAHERLEHMARYDQLTGLANRSLFWSFINKTYANASRHNEKFALLYIDLDRFKQVNDTMGHDAGDKLLQKTSERLENCVRDSDLIARLGGDEFAIILSHVDSPEMAALLADRIVKSLCEPFRIMGQSVNIGASVGVANFPDHGEDVASLSKNADTAMYIAKEKGRNNFQFYHEEMQQKIERHMNFADGLIHACENQDLQAIFSPIVDANGGDTFCQLLQPQWLSAEDGWQNVGRSLEVTLTHRIAHVLDKWQIDTALRCLEAMQQQDRQISLAVSLYMTDNLLEKGALVEYIRLKLEASSIAPSQLILRLTEACHFSASTAVGEQLDQLRALGVGLSLIVDNHGDMPLEKLSHSRLKFLEYDINTLERDLESLESQRILQAFFAVARTFELTTFIGGVQESQQQDSLQQLGCQYLYGAAIGDAVKESDLK